MSEQQTTEADANGFFINNGAFTGNFTTPEGDKYNIRKLEARDVTRSDTGEAVTLWGGYAAARDLGLSAADAQLQTRFRKDGRRPAEFAPESKDIPLYITLRHNPGKGYTHIGSFWNAKGRYTILARDLGGKSGLRFGGHVLAWKSKEALEAERAAKAGYAAPLDAPTPDGDAARANAGKRSRKGAPAQPVNE